MKRKLILLISIILLIVISACKKQEEKTAENKVESATEQSVSIVEPEKKEQVESESIEKNSASEEEKVAEAEEKHIPFIKADIEKEYDIQINNCGYDFIEDYDYTLLDDEKKLNYAIKKYMDLLYKPSISNALGINEDKEAVCYDALEKYEAYLLQSIKSINNKNIINSKKYNFVYTLSYLAKDGLYEYDKVVEHIKKLNNITENNINEFLNDNETSNTTKSVYNLIKLINDYESNGKSFSIIDLANNIQSKNLKNAVLFTKGNFDIFNSHTNFFTEIVVEGSSGLYGINITPKNIDDKILLRFIETFSKRDIDSSSYDYDYVSILQDYIAKYAGGTNIVYFMPFKNDIYVYEESQTMQNGYNIYLYTIDTTDDYGEKALFVRNMNGENTIDVEKLQADDIEEITQEEGYKKAKKSKFMKDGKLDDMAYSQYLLGYVDSVKGQHYLVPSKFIKFDINNDKKKEYFGVFELLSSTDGETGTYYIMLNEKTLEVEDNEINKFLMDFMGKEHILVQDTGDYQEKYQNYAINCPIYPHEIGTGGIRNFYQKLYTEDGINKIILIEDKAKNLYVDIIVDKDYLEANIGKYIRPVSEPEFVWNGELKNGKPVGLLNTDASFDMSKASTLSELAIVSDVNLRMLDKLSSEKYFKSVENVDENTKKNLLNKRRQMNKEIKNCKGDYKCIRDILYIDVFVENEDI